MSRVPDGLGQFGEKTSDPLAIKFLRRRDNPRRESRYERAQRGASEGPAHRLPGAGPARRPGCKVASLAEARSRRRVKKTCS